MSGYFINTDGFTLEYCKEKSTWRKTIYEFTSKPESLTYFTGTRFWQPDKHFYTDMGSVPKWAQPLIPKDRFLGFYLHDAGYIHRGLWVRIMEVDEGNVITATSKFEFIYMTRREVDDLLYEMMIHDPKKPWTITAKSVWIAVRMWGWMFWGRGDCGKSETRGGTIDPLKTGGIITTA